MVNRVDTLRRLRKERDYEEKISNDLSIYFLESLENIEDLSEEETEELNNKLQEILDDSIKHHKLISGLMDYTQENEKDTY